ncbi:MAG: 30S ribosomal protein S12 methylthiotransferase RimO, partial [Chloroflexota bacterium]|nr:30S ribosomal protein S12 methylthiotransferase RimO [Chloroflexota bacterium]
MKFHLLTLGCPKNVVDSEGMTRLLVQDGHVPVATARQADVIIVNTCGFIDIAKEESLNVLAAAGRTKRRGQVLIAAGCLAERFAADLQVQAPYVDAVLGTRHWDQIPALVARLGFSATAPLSGKVPSAHAGPRPSAYLKIADGCDSSCAFCVIPQIKGPYQSKPVEQVLAEARDLADQGVQEIVLVAQDTTLYGSDRGVRDGLASLLEELLASVPSVPWWRIMYAYPQHITPRLIRTMAENPRVCRYLDLPLQHAHPATLQRMGRPSNVDQARELIGRLREAMPGIALRSSFIVGYPGETEAEFAALLAFLKEVRLDRAGFFTYSPEEGTVAAGLPGPVSPRV